MSQVIQASMSNKAESWEEVVEEGRSLGPFVPEKSPLNEAQEKQTALLEAEMTHEDWLRFRQLCRQSSQSP